jgi:hypothetical protein
MLLMPDINKINKITKLTMDIMEISNKTKNKDAEIMYRKGIEELAHIMLYLHISPEVDVMFRVGALDWVVSELRKLDTENYDKINKGFLELFNELVKDYGRGTNK